MNGLDVYFFAHKEENDFWWRVQLAGYKVYACPKSTVYHVGGGTLPKGDRKKVFLNFRNNLVMLSKNLPKSQSWWKIPVRIVLDTVSAFKSLFEGEGNYFVAVFDAHMGFIKWYYSRRTGSGDSGGRRDIPLTGWYSKSVVWAHFVRGKKKFLEIVKGKE